MVRRRRLSKLLRVSLGLYLCKLCREVVTTFVAGFAIGCAIAVLMNLNPVFKDGVVSRLTGKITKAPLSHKEIMEESDPHEELSGPALMKFGPLKHSSAEDYHLGEDMVAKRMANEIRVLCMVITHTNRTETMTQIKNTWGSRCNKLFFVSGFNDSELGSVAFPNLTRGMRWGLTRAGFDHAWQHYHYEADWFLRADDDTYVLLENLRYMLSTTHHDKPIYFGLKLKGHVKQGYMSGGSGYVLSKGALRKFMDVAFNNHSICRDSPGAQEDIEMGRCLENVGVPAGDSRDNLGRHRFLIFHPKRHLIPAAVAASQTWMWNASYYPIAEGMDCCSDRAVAFHSISHDEMFVLEYLLYHLRPYGISRMEHHSHQNGTR